MASRGRHRNTRSTARGVARQGAWRDGGMGALGAALGGLLVLALIGYRAMIAVKPKVARPTVGDAERAEIAALEGRLMEHVRVLGARIGERNLNRPLAFRAAADYIREIWAGQRFVVVEEPFEVGGVRAINLVAERRGSARPGAIVLVGAHYDSVAGSPGANDNATGVALLLELSRAMREEVLATTVRFVAFANEEPPYFMREGMGSRVDARQARRRGEDILAMVSLETLGCYSNAPGSQRYPFPFGAFYPSTGNFLAVVGNLRSRVLVVDFLRRFMAASDFPVEGVASPQWIPGIAWSDHWAFWEEGYRALMLTDTAPFRYPKYHSRGDLPDAIDAAAFARVGHGIIQAVRQMVIEP